MDKGSLGEDDDEAGGVGGADEGEVDEERKENAEPKSGHWEN